MKKLSCFQNFEVDHITKNNFIIMHENGYNPNDIVPLMFRDKSLTHPFVIFDKGDYYSAEDDNLFEEFRSEGNTSTLISSHFYPQPVNLKDFTD